jgi:hypothetical protein
LISHGSKTNTDFYKFCSRRCAFFDSVFPPAQYQMGGTIQREVQGFDGGSLFLSPFCMAPNAFCCSNRRPAWRG